MDYSKLVPSRELCEELQRLGICQDGAELWWKYGGMTSDNQRWEVMTKTVSHRNYQTNAVIAPTLSRMLEGLPKNGYSFVIQPFSDVWYIRDLMTRLDVEDKHLPNAVAKALIAIKKGVV